MHRNQHTNQWLIMPWSPHGAVDSRDEGQCSWVRQRDKAVLVDAETYNELEMWPMPSVMAALPNIGAPSVQRSKVWLTPTTRVPCSNAAKTRNRLKFAGVPQTNETISAAYGPKFTILWGHVEDILLLNKFFRLSIHALFAKI